jgi:hypothetical protein
VAIVPDGLRIGSQGERLPLSAAAARHVMLAKSGYGKTNASAVMTEEIVRANVHTIVFDPLGKMHGLRSSADGESAGLQLAVLGGRHGDVPLRADRGAYVCDQLLEGPGVSAVLDFSQLEDDEESEFVKDLLSRIAVRIDHVVMLVFEEAERFVPERSQARAGAHAQLAGVTNRFVRECRNFGVGYVASTQRPQLLGKPAIEAAEFIYAMRMMGSSAQSAIGSELKTRVDKGLAAKVLTDVQALERGGAWLIPDDEETWGVPRRIRFRMRNTFEIQPPKIGEIARAPRVFAAVDLDRLRDAMAQDPQDADVDGVAVNGSEVAELRATIADLRARVATPVEVPVLPTTIAAELRAWSSDYEAIVEKAARVAERGNEIADRIVMALNSVVRAAAVETPQTSRKSIETLDKSLSASTLSRAATAIVEVLVAHYPAKFTRAQVATLSGRSIKSSSFGPHLSEGLDSGLLERGADGRIGATAEALKAFGHVPPRSAAEVREQWLKAMPTPGARRMLEVLFKARGALAREQWADLASVSVTSSALGKHIGTIVDNGLAVRRSDGSYVLSEVVR